MISTPIRSAKFVVPKTTAEFNQVRKARVQRVLVSPLSFLCKLTGTARIALLKSAMDARYWDTPSLHNRLYKILSPNLEAIRPFYTFGFLVGNMYFVEKNPELAKAVLVPDRHGEIFRYSIPSICFMSLLKRVYPEIEFKDEDFIATCPAAQPTSPETEPTCPAPQPKEYRSPLLEALNEERIEKARGKIAAIAAETVSEWFASQKGKAIDITELTRLYALRMTSEILFNKNIASPELAKALNSINTFIVKEFTQKFTSKEDQLEVTKNCQIIRDAIESIIAVENHSYMDLGRSGMDVLKDATNLFKNSNLTPDQKRGHIFLDLFAAQETLAALQTSILWTLASDQKQQDEVRAILPMGRQTENVKRVFVNFLRNFTPAYINQREVGDNPVILKYTFDNGTESSQVFFPGEKIFITPYTLAPKIPYEVDRKLNAGFPFGGGPHICPGRFLAMAATEELIAAALCYDISTEQKSVVTRAEFTLGFPEEVLIKLDKKTTSATPASHE